MAVLAWVDLRVSARHGWAGEKAAQLGPSQSPLQVFVSRKYGEGGVGKKR